MVFWVGSIRKHGMTKLLRYKKKTVA
jgi:hypothetical protein